MFQNLTIQVRYEGEFIIFMPLLTQKTITVKNIFPFIIALAALAFSCNKPTGFIISGKITNAGEKYLYLDELKVSSSVPVDSVRLKKDGTFKFKGKISYPNFYLLKLSQKNFITLLVDTTEKITVYGDAANFSRDYIVEGSPGSLLVQKLNNKLAITKHKLDSIRSWVSAFQNRDDYSIKKAKWDQELSDIKQQQIRFSTDFVQKHPFSMSSVLALYQKFDDANYVVQDLQSLKIAASALNSIFPKSEHVKALYINTQQIMLEEKNNKLHQLISLNGVNSPDIILPNLNGRKIPLSSFNGKIVLIQFWSALNRDSRIQNGALVDLYNKYKSRGFEIYQVSIDTDRVAWQAAIEMDGLSWTNVGDMRGSVAAVNSYNIQAIPSNYILDREGHIAAKNLIGPELDQAVGTLIK